MKFTKYFTFTLLAFSLLSFSQMIKKEGNLSINSGTINNQFEYLLKKSGNFRGTNNLMYEAVKLKMLLSLKANTIDSLNTLRKNLADTKALIKTQVKDIKDLKTNLANTREDLNKINIKKNNMLLFGMQISKMNYNILMWVIVLALLVLLLLFIYKFKNSNAITKKAKYALSEIEEEFNEHRKTALVREQKVRRQLQDEINKQKKAK